MYQFVSTPYDVIAADALFGGGPVKEASDLLKHMRTVWPSFL
jgi:hypothetical protein